MSPEAKVSQDFIRIQSSGRHSYKAVFDPEWRLGASLIGGAVAAIANQAAQRYFQTTLKELDQPDVLSLHVEFLRLSVHADFDIEIEDLKIGRGTSTVLLRLSQKNQVKAVATATSTNFDRPYGPSAPTAQSAMPFAVPPPDFDKIDTNVPDDRWLPIQLSGDLVPYLRGQIGLYPREGYPEEGVWHAWINRLDERTIDGAYLTLQTDGVPSISDTLLRNGGVFDAQRIHRQANDWASRYPGTRAELEATIAESSKASIWNNTLFLNVEYKRRLTEQGLSWIHMASKSKSMEGGKLDLDITTRDRSGNILCSARQLMLVLPASRRFRKGEAPTTRNRSCL